MLGSSDFTHAWQSLLFFSEILENRKQQEDVLLRQSPFNLIISQARKKSFSDGEAKPQTAFVDKFLRSSKLRSSKAESKSESNDLKTTDVQHSSETQNTATLDAGKFLTAIIYFLE